VTRLRWLHDDPSLKGKALQLSFEVVDNFTPSDGPVHIHQQVNRSSPVLVFRLLISSTLISFHHATFDSDSMHRNKEDFVTANLDTGPMLFQMLDQGIVDRVRDPELPKKADEDPHE